MNKIYLGLLTLILCTPASFAQTTNAAPYCTPVFGSSSTTAGISSVQYNSTTNATALSNNTYTFYNNLPNYTISPFAAVSNLCFTVTAGGGTGNRITLLIDWNHNNVFDMPDEIAQTQNIGSGGSVGMCGNFSDTALGGVTRARLMWVGSTTPCGSPNATPYEGEIEDYQVELTGMKAIPRVTAATNTGSRTMTLNGTVHANGSGAASVDFEYGLTTSYSNSVSGGSVTANAHTPVSANINGLQPATIYHYRVKATNSKGVSYSPDKTFITATGVGVGNTSLPAFTIAMNPGSGTFQVKGLTAGYSYGIEAYDIRGRKVFAGSVETEGTLNLSHLSKGTYFLKVVDTKSPAQPMVSRIVIE